MKRLPRKFTSVNTTITGTARIVGSTSTNVVPYPANPRAYNAIAITYARTNATTLQLDADYDTTDATTAFQGRAVFEPSQSGQQTVTNETWQTWNPLTAPSGWWQTGNAIVGGNNVGKACTQAIPCSFAQLLSAYPNAAIRPVTGQSAGQPIAGRIWLKAGGGWAGGFTGNVDSLTAAVDIGGTNGTVTYDFEP